MAGGGQGALPGPAAVLFVAGVLARLPGPVLWSLQQRDLFAPKLAGAGLHPDRVIYAEAADEAGVMTVLEEGLRHGGLAGVVGEVSVLSMTASRRLQRVAEGHWIEAAGCAQLFGGEDAMLQDRVPRLAAMGVSAAARLH